MNRPTQADIEIAEKAAQILQLLGAYTSQDVDALVAASQIAVCQEASAMLGVIAMQLAALHNAVAAARLHSEKHHMGDPHRN